MERYTLEKYNDTKYSIIDNSPFPTVIETFDDFDIARETLDIYNQYANNQVVKKYIVDYGNAYTYAYFNSDLEARDWFYRYFKPLDCMSHLTKYVKLLREDKSLVGFYKFKSLVDETERRIK